MAAPVRPAKSLCLGGDAHLNLHLPVILAFDWNGPVKFLQSGNEALDGSLAIRYGVLVSPAPGLTTGKRRHDDAIAALR